MRSLRLALVCGGVLGLVSAVNAAVSVSNYWKIGEADTGKVAGSTLSDHTTRTTGAWDMYVQPWPTPAPTSVYSSDVPAAASLPAGAASTLSVRLNGLERWTYWAGDFRPTDNFGVEAWVKPAALTGTQVVVYAGAPSASGGIGMMLVNNQVRIHYGGVGSITWDAPGLAVDTWTHLAIVRDTGVTKLYVNGTNVSPATPFTTAPLWPAVAPSAAFAVGAYSYGGSNLTGNIDNVRLFTFSPGAFASSDLLVAAVPEPVSMGLVGLVGMALLRRRARA